MFSIFTPLRAVKSYFYHIKLTESSICFEILLSNYKQKNEINLASSRYLNVCRLFVAHSFGAGR